MSDGWANVIIAIIVAASSWTATIVALTWFLSSKFRHLEASFYHEINKHKDRTVRRLNEHSLRINRLEVAHKGWTEVLGEDEEA